MKADNHLGCFTGLSEALRRLVKQSILSQKEIAERAGVLESSLSKYISGDNNPGLGALGRIVEDGLGLTLLDLAEALRQARGSAPPVERRTISVDELEDQVQAFLSRLRHSGEKQGSPTKTSGDSDD